MHVFNAFLLTMGIIDFITAFVNIVEQHYLAGVPLMFVALVLIGLFCLGLFAIVKENILLLIIYDSILGTVGLLCLILFVLTFTTVGTDIIIHDTVYYEKERRSSLHISGTWLSTPLMLIVPQFIITIFLILALKDMNLQEDDNK